MPADWTFDGLVPHHFPETRDANGVHLGLVAPGDVRVFEDPPVSFLWHETTDEERAALAAREGGGEPADGPDGGSEDQEDAGAGQDEAAPEPAGPVPAPPAVVPPAVQA